MLLNPLGCVLHRARKWLITSYQRFIFKSGRQEGSQKTDTFHTRIYQSLFLKIACPPPPPSKATRWDSRGRRSHLTLNVLQRYSKCIHVAVQNCVIYITEPLCDSLNLKFNVSFCFHRHGLLTLNIILIIWCSFFLSFHCWIRHHVTCK